MNIHPFIQQAILHSVTDVRARILLDISREIAAHPDATYTDSLPCVGRLVGRQQTADSTTVAADLEVIPGWEIVREAALSQGPFLSKLPRYLIETVAGLFRVALQDENALAVIAFFRTSDGEDALILQVSCLEKTVSAWAVPLAGLGEGSVPTPHELPEGFLENLRDVDVTKDITVSMREWFDFRPSLNALQGESLGDLYVKARDNPSDQPLMEMHMPVKRDGSLLN